MCQCVRQFFCYWTFLFLHFIFDFFRFFSYITIVNFGFQATGHIFSPRNVIHVFGLRELCTIYQKLKTFEIYGLKIPFFTPKGVIFPFFFFAIFQNNLCDS